MEVQTYLNKKKKLFSDIIAYFENNIDDNDEFQNIINYFLDSKVIDKNNDDLKEFFKLLINISKNLHRNQHFFKKLEQILIFYQNDIKRIFTNSEIFTFFQDSKLILLVLMINQIIIIERININSISDNIEFCHFFSQNIKSSVCKDKVQISEDFENKCKLGENDSYISTLIRNDLIDEFVTYVNQTNLSISSTIKPSNFETNSFLINKEPTLIEYSAFFGSIQIFQYLRLNNVQLTSSLWLYAIHSNNADMIHLLEENQVKPEDETYEECLEEAIKCYHNEIANYIQNQYVESNDKKFIEYSFKYINYFFFPNELNSRSTVYYMCKYNYITLVKFFLKSNCMIKYENGIF